MFAFLTLPNDEMVGINPTLVTCFRNSLDHEAGMTSIFWGDYRVGVKENFHQVDIALTQSARIS